MPSFQLPNPKVIPAFNALTFLQAWLRPGLLAYVVADHFEALRPTAVRLSTEQNAMLDEAALKYPDVWPADTPEGNKGEPHPKAGQHVTGMRGADTVTLFKSKEAGDEYIKRLADLMSPSITVAVDIRLTVDDFRKLETERLPAPRSTNNVGAAEVGAVDFAALLPLLERSAPATTDTPAVAAPQLASAGVV